MRFDRRLRVNGFGGFSRRKPVKKRSGPSERKLKETNFLSVIGWIIDKEKFDYNNKAYSLKELGATIYMVIINI